MNFNKAHLPVFWVILFLILFGFASCKDGGNNQNSTTSESPQSEDTGVQGDPAVQGEDSGSPTNSTVFGSPDQLALGQSADLSLAVNDLPYKRFYYSFSSYAGAPQIFPRSGVLEVARTGSAQLLASITASQTGVQTYTLHLTTQEGQSIDFDFSINITAN